jgi:hypothetical protein
MIVLLMLRLLWHDPVIWRDFAGHQAESSSKSWRPAAGWQEETGSCKARAKEGHPEGERKVCASIHFKIFVVVTTGTPAQVQVALKPLKRALFMTEMD